MRSGLQHNEDKELWTPQREDTNSESDIDDEHKTFLDHLREDGHSYVFENSHVCIKYEEEDESFSGHATETQGGPEIDRRRRCFASRKKPITSQSKSGISPSNAVKHLEARKTAVDPYYQVFLRHVMARGNHTFLKLDNGVTIKYGDDTESPNALTTTKATPFPGGQPELNDGLEPSHTFVPMFEDDATFTGISRRCKISYYEKGLMSVCDQPFDQGEFDNLLRMVSTREPKMRDRHLRTGIKTYPTKEMAKSYFNRYPDFAKQIRTACCRNHRLKQLRGFTFWLKNLCHEGAFKPWEDEHFNVCDRCW